jgi:CelD/BcsL family acetyltransferase involved in cellulose biosynthesis
VAPGSIVTVRARLLPLTEVSTVERIWQDLEERVGAGRLAVSWTWTSTWLRHFADTVRPRFAVVERRGSPIAAALVVVSLRGPRVSPVRTLHLGTAGEPAGHTVFVEYNDLLCAPADREPVTASLLEAIRVAGGWDQFCVDGFRPDTTDAMRAVVPFVVRAEQSWTIRLSVERSVLEGLKGSTRRLVRQARESLQPAEPEVADGVDAAVDALAELAELHRRRWNSVGEPGAFASPRRSGFLSDIVRAWLPEGRARLFRLRGPDGTLGCVLGFVEDGRFLYYQGGFRQFEDNRKRTGLLSHVVFAEDCRRHGLREYELLVGDAQYKRQLSGGEFNSLIWAYYCCPSVRGRVLTAARALRRARAEFRARRSAGSLAGPRSSAR